MVDCGPLSFRPTRSTPRIPALLFATNALASALVACSGTGDGGTGDPPGTPPAEPLGAGLRIHELIGPAKWVDPDDLTSEACSPPGDRNVWVSGVRINAIDRFDETGDGARGNFYVQDAMDDPPAYAGVTVFDPSFTPPDLKLVPGDVVDVFGVYTEFLGPSSGKFGYCRTLPEIGGALSFRFDGRDTAKPKTIPLADLREYASARRWLGMLVRVEDVTIATAGQNFGGRFTAAIDVGGGISQADVPTVSNELYDLEAEGPPLPQGATFASITGILTYFYGFRLAPRSAADFEP